MKHPKSFLLTGVLFLLISPKGISQDDIRIPDSTITYQFIESLDSVPLSRTINLLEPGNPEIKLELNSEWDPSGNTWMNLSREEDHFDGSGNPLFHLEFSWDQDLGIWEGKEKLEQTYDIDGNLTAKENYVKGVDQLGEEGWIPASKSTFLYGSTGNATNVVHFQGVSIGIWIPVDSFLHVWDSYDQTSESHNYGWIPEESRWSYKRGNSYQREWNPLGEISSLTEFRKDHMETEWIPYDSAYYIYDDLGSRTQEVNFFWSAGSATWELEKKWEHLFNETLQMKLQARYEWNPLTMLWEGYSMAMGNSTVDNTSSVAIGLWNRDGNEILWMSKDEREYSPDGVLLRRLTYGWDSDMNDWNIEAQRTYSYNEQEELVCEEISNWVSEDADFKLDKKVYNFYPGTLGTPQFPLGLSKGFLHIYPNPVDELMVVNCEGIPVRIDLLNLNGQLMLSTPETELNLLSIPSGIYLVQVHLRNGDVLSGKVIKR